VLADDPGLHLYARLEESTGPRSDSSARANHLSPVNGPGNSSDRREGAASLELVRSGNQYLERAAASLAPGFPGLAGAPNAALTVAGWVKIGSPGNQPLVLKSETGERSWSLWVWDFGSGPQFDPNVYDTSGADFPERGVGDFGGSTVLEVGQWYHFAYIYDGTAACLANGTPSSGVSRLYVNGALDAGPFCENMSAYFAGSAPLRIGYRPGFGADSYADARLDEVLVLDRALGGVEVAGLYQHGVLPPGAQCDACQTCLATEGCSGAPCAATPTTTATGTPTRSPTASATATGVAVASPTATWSPPPPSTPTPTGTATTSPTTTPTATPAPVFSATPTLAGPVLAYCFDEANGTTTADNSGNGHTGILNGSPARQAGRYGSALRFDGNRSGYQFVTFGPDDALDALAQGTIMAWIKPAATSSGFRGWFQSGQGGECQSPMELALSGSLLEFWGGGGGCSATLDAVATIAGPVTDWHHLAYVVDAVGNRFYVDGQLRAASYFTGTASTRVFFAQTQAGVSRYRVGSTESPSETFDGLIDEFRIYASPLTQAQIQSAMNASFCAP
jgi:hypothetical protein